jgi:hypothetical protein
MSGMNQLHPRGQDLRRYEDLHIFWWELKTRLSTDTPDTFLEFNKSFSDSSSGKAFLESDIEALVGSGHGYGA